MTIPWDSITTVFSVILGAAIAGAGTLWQARVDHKKAVAMALSELLEVRHRMIAFQTMVHEFKAHFQMSDELVPVILDMLNKVLPKDPNLHERYSQSVQVIAGVDPLLAFRLRSKDGVNDFIDNLTLMSAQNGVPTQESSKFDEFLRKHIVPVLDEALLELADAHSRCLLKQVKKKLSEPPNPEWKKIIEDLKLNLLDHQNIQLGQS